MEMLADLHLHSKYARATSPKADVDHLAEWARRKGSWPCPTSPIPRGGGR